MLSYGNPVPVDGNSPSPTNVASNVPSVVSNFEHPMLSSSKSTNSNDTVHTVNGTDQHHHIWLVTGPAGCGKSTVAQYLAKSLNFPYIEGDEFHSASSIAKMSNGIPLTDEDRWDWLTSLREESLRRIHGGTTGVVLTCSALKRKYRDVIRVAKYYDHDIQIHFIYLHAPESVLIKRVQGRQNHFMTANMVKSQLAILEPPRSDETDAISLDVSPSLEEVQREALDRVLALMTIGN